MAIENITRIIQYRDTKSNIESLSGSLEESAISFATDTGQLGLYANGAWIWFSQTGSAGGGGISERSIPIYDEHVFIVTGTAIDFVDNISVVASGSVAFVQGQAGGGGSGLVPIFDNSVFMVSGTAISFDDNLSVSVTGTKAFVNASSGGGWTLISDQTLTSTGTFTISSIPNSYRMLFLFADLRSIANQTSDTVDVRFGAGSVDSGSNYGYMIRWEGQAQSNQTSASGTHIRAVICPGLTAETGFFGSLEMVINDYAVIGNWRNCTVKGGQADQAGERACYGMGTWRNTGSALDTIYLFSDLATYFSAGSRLKLYGV